MGGCCCCCASKGEELNNAPPFYHYPSTAEPHQPLSLQGRVSALSTGLLVDTNLDTSIPETYRAPPAPVPYETNVGCPQSPLANRECHGDKNETVQLTEKPVEETNTRITQETTVKVVESDGNANVELTAVKEVDDDLEKSGELKKPSEPTVKLLPEEEDVCPTCLEEYDAENPKIITKCEHHFHLGCILEWMERSETCPVCDQEMVFSIGNDA